MNRVIYRKLTRVFIGIISIFNINCATAQAAKKLDSLFTTLYNREQFNGCVLVAEKGIPIYEKSFGFANFETKELLTNNTMFELASVSKQFTTMAIMQLHEKGMLQYGDSYRKILSGTFL